jgi:hypothetical protein
MPAIPHARSFFKECGILPSIQPYMKYLIVIVILLNYLCTSGQEGGRIFLQTGSKTGLYYVDLNDSFAFVYKMGFYDDAAGRGYVINQTDTLAKQLNGTYYGRFKEIISENNKFYLVTKSKSKKKHYLEVVKASALSGINNNLNNAYYLDHYFKMAHELNRSYPLNHHSFRDGFYSWERIQNKEKDYLQFRELANVLLKSIKDSISLIQDSHGATTNYLVQNVNTVNYSILKDSLTKLPPDYKSKSWYYGTVINEVAKQQPTYFFKLAEDFPENRSLIFIAPDDSKDVLQALKMVEGHDKIKKEFLKDRRFRKTLIYRIIGVYAVVGGLVTWLIVSQP